MNYTNKYPQLIKEKNIIMRDDLCFFNIRYNTNSIHGNVLNSFGFIIENQINKINFINFYNDLIRTSLKTDAILTEVNFDYYNSYDDIFLDDIFIDDLSPVQQFSILMNTNPNLNDIFNLNIFQDAERLINKLNFIFVLNLTEKEIEIRTNTLILEVNQ